MPIVRVPLVREAACLAVLLVAQVALVVAAAGWYRQVAGNGLGRAVESQLLRSPVTLSIRRASWPSRIVDVSPAQARAGLSLFGNPRWLELAGHSVILPQQIGHIYLWRYGKVPSDGKIHIALAGGGKSKAFSIPLRLQKSSDRSPILYGHKSATSIVLSWSHSVGKLGKSGWPVFSFPLVRRFRVFLPAWARVIAVEGTGRGGTPIGLGCTEVASSQSRHHHHCVVGVLFGHLPLLRAVAGPVPPPDLLRTCSTLFRLAGAPPWRGKALAMQGWAGLAGKSSARGLMLAFGLSGSARNPPARMNILGAVAAADYVWEIGPRMGTIFRTTWPGYSLCYCVAAEPRINGSRLIQGQSFYLFNHDGVLVAKGTVAVSGAERNDKGIGLAMGACGMARRAGAYPAARAAR